MWHFPGLPFQHRMKWWNDLPVYWRKPQVFFVTLQTNLHYECFSCFETCNVFSIFRKRTANLRPPQQVRTIANLVYTWGSSFPIEYWMITGDQAFLPSYYLARLPHPLPAFPCLSSASSVGWARSQIIRPRESMVFYKKILCTSSTSAQESIPPAICSLADRYYN